MRNIFIINPAAGKGASKTYLEKIGKIADRLNIPAEIYITTAISDGESFVKKVCKSRKASEPLRFFACGGDGTLNEVINGVYGYENVEVGSIPCGTGNDFIRNFKDQDSFKNINAQLNGQSVYCDLINYQGICDGQHVNRYCANMFNIGFDCNVVDLTSKIKEKTVFKGSFAYLLGVATILIKKKGALLKIHFENGEVYDKKILLIAIANGCFCGGGVKGVPKASLFDGKFDVSIINNISRNKFIKLFPKYSKGTHISYNKIDDILTYKQTKKLTIEPKNKTMKLCVDGEIFIAEKICFSIKKRGIKFIIPQIK